MNFDDYLALDAVNWSTLSFMRKSPLHYRYRCDHERPDTDALRLGRAGHTAIFEPDRFALEYAIEPDFGDVRKTDRTTKEDAKKNKTARDAWRAANAVGRTMLTEKQYWNAIGMRDAVRAHREIAPYLEKGQAEVSLTWTDRTTGLACKGRLDFVSESKPAILDLKTAAEIQLDLFAARSVHRYGAHSQLAFYRDGWETRHGVTLPVVIIAVESSPPFDVGPFLPDDDTMDEGSAECARLLELVSVHRNLNTWPGRYPFPASLRLPKYAFPDDEDLTETDLDWSGTDG